MIGLIVEADEMATPLFPSLSRVFPKNFWLGIALAICLWGLLALGTVIG